MERHVSRGGGYHDESLKHFGGACFEMHRCQDAKRYGLLSLNLRNILISPLEGEKKFLSELCELRNFREGYKKYKNKDCGTESGMTVFGANLMILFRGMHRSCIGRSALLCRQGKKNYNRLGILEQHKIELEEVEPLSRISNAHYHSQRIAPSPRWVEGIDSVISFDFISKKTTTHENNLPRKELSALVPQYLSNFSETVFSRFTSHFSLKRKAAFTLAEVLITLGIIGIVASMTLPSLIQSYKERVTVTKVQKAYSVLNQAFKRISEEYGEPQDWPGVEKQIASCGECSIAHLNLYSNFISGEKYIAPRVNQDKKIIGLNGGFFTFSDSRPSLITPDGTFYFSHLRQCGVYSLTTGNRSACTMGGDILYDIDGEQKGPNQLGKDVFSFVTAQTGVYPAGMVGSYNAGDCKLNGGGYSCAEYILREKNMKYLKK